MIPRLMHPEWRKMLYETADLVVSLPVGHPTWPKAMFERNQQMHSVAKAVSRALMCSKHKKR